MEAELIALRATNAQQEAELVSARAEAVALKESAEIANQAMMDIESRLFNAEIALEEERTEFAMETEQHQTKFLKIQTKLDNVERDLKFQCAECQRMKVERRNIGRQMS